MGMQDDEQSETGQTAPPLLALTVGSGRDIAAYRVIPAAANSMAAIVSEPAEAFRIATTPPFIDP